MDDEVAQPLGDRLHPPREGGGHRDLGVPGLDSAPLEELATGEQLEAVDAEDEEAVHRPHHQQLLGCAVA